MTLKKNAARVAVQAEPCQIDAQELYFRSVIPCARAKVIQALEVVDCAVEDVPHDEVWGLRNLLDWLDSRFEHHEDQKSQEFFDLSCSTNTVIAVLNVLNQARDHLLLHAANTVLGVAKQMLEDAEAARARRVHDT